MQSINITNKKGTGYLDEIQELIIGIIIFFIAAFLAIQFFTPEFNAQEKTAENYKKELINKLEEAKKGNTQTFYMWNTKNAEKGTEHATYYLIDFSKTTVIKGEEKERFLYPTKKGELCICYYLQESDLNEEKRNICNQCIKKENIGEYTLKETEKIIEEKTRLIGEPTLYAQNVAKLGFLDARPDGKKECEAFGGICGYANTEEIQMLCNEEQELDDVITCSYRPDYEPGSIYHYNCFGCLQKEETYTETTYTTKKETNQIKEGQQIRISYTKQGYTIETIKG